MGTRRAKALTAAHLTLSKCPFQHSGPRAVTQSEPLHNRLVGRGERDPRFWHIHSPRGPGWRWGGGSSKARVRALSHLYSRNEKEFRRLL